ncbi:Oidioi.mRNA.OKI2018_I69.XSR.g15252.t1.cds [Oikopleura dioica]|uniref:Oidioi.mRNA.OKI2018_I69.XSR.g15252.t1.cds n=1 Tax=Oikopleura dioica TaxID=34765 RepID=A0ABN7SHD0_OIKDI|nr:Oidioi.mRNA.OKI2018_I69.XSR.g15252.t1.cds [Oikopleura dioica]
MIRRLNSLRLKKNERNDYETRAFEACRWLRQTGFPQYAQLFIDGKFPLYIDAIINEHDFLEKDSQRAVRRRLELLNKAAIAADTIAATPPPMHGIDIMDGEDDVCLSQLWTLDRKKQVWARNKTQGVRRSASTPNSRCRISPRVTQLQPTSEDSDMDQSNEINNEFASLDRRGMMKTSSFMRKFRPLSNHRTRERPVRKKTITIGNPILKSGMENLYRYNCRDISSTGQRTTKLSDKTDSDTTSGLGLDIGLNTASSDSENSENFISDSGKRFTQLYLSDSTSGSMRRPNSIYDNLNDEETTNLSSELSVNNNDDFDQIQTPNNTLNPSQRKDESFAEEMDTLQKGMLEELESIKRMLTDVNLLFEKNDDTLERPKQSRNEQRHAFDCFFGDEDDEDEEQQNGVELFIPESTYDASSTRSFSVSADISESMCPRDDAGSRGPNSTMDDSGQESDHFEADQTWHVPVRTRSCRKRLRWKSFYRDHQPSFRSRNVQLSNLSAGQVMMLRKIAMLRLTSYMERYSTIRNNETMAWSLPFKLNFKRLKSNSLRAKKYVRSEPVKKCSKLWTTTAASDATSITVSTTKRDDTTGSCSTTFSDFIRQHYHFHLMSIS